MRVTDSRVPVSTPLNAGLHGSLVLVVDLHCSFSEYVESSLESLEQPASTLKRPCTGKSWIHHCPRIDRRVTDHHHPSHVKLVFQIHRANIFLILCIFGEIQQNGMLAAPQHEISTNHRKPVRSGHGALGRGGY